MAAGSARSLVQSLVPRHGGTVPQTSWESCADRADQLDVLLNADLEEVDFTESVLVPIDIEKDLLTEREEEPGTLFEFLLNKRFCFKSAMVKNA